MFFTPIQCLLPLQVEDIDPVAKEASLGVVMAVVALVSLVASPIAGAISDRTSSRLGRRRSWVLWPTLAAVAVLVLAVLVLMGGLTTTGGLTTIGGLVFGWALGQLTLNESYATVTAWTSGPSSARSRTPGTGSPSSSAGAHARRADAGKLGLLANQAGGPWRGGGSLGWGRGGAGWSVAWGRLPRVGEGWCRVVRGVGEAP
ncbi:MAG: MFS transporter [Actinomycetota bacterium]